jgi:regulation of enolase protein 1 (concanavalin A-like superfamily)
LVWITFAALLGCGAPSGDEGAVNPSGASLASTNSVVGGSCANPAAGCPCTTAGAIADCGQVDRISGGYVTCTMGHTTCSNGAWGACIGDQIATKAMTRTVAHGLDLGTPQTCVNDPCDPACMQVVDTPLGLDAGSDSGFEITEAGLTPLPIVQSDAGVVCTGLTVNPATLNVTVVGLNPLTTSPALPTLAASYAPANCYGGLAPASWSLDKAGLAAISNGSLTLVSAVSGPITATAYSAGFQASATIQVTTNVVDSSQVTAPVAQLFTGPPAQSDNIQIIYPYPRTVFPRALAAPIVQWNNNGVAATAVKVTVQYPATGTPTYSVSEIIPESNPPQAQISQDGWSFLDQTAAGQDALLSVQRLVNGVLMNPVTETIHFASAPLRGNIFYTEYDVVAWTATIKSAKPSGTTAAQVAMASAGCNPCHTVSANGTTLITSNWGYNDTSVAHVNADGTLTGLANMWNASTGLDSRGFAYSAITPDGLYALQGSNWWGNTLEPTQDQGASKPHGNGSGLTGAYYAGTSPSGSPSFTRNDANVDFAWGASSPGGTLAAGSSYFVSWTGYVQPIFSETYTFEVESSDGATLTVNGQQLVNRLGPQTDTKWSGTIALTAGTKVPITLTYENVTNTSQVHLRWSSADQPYQVVAETQLYPSNPAPTGLLGTYYSNINLTGSTFQRIDPNVNFNWNGGTPVSGWSGTNWSAEWTGKVLTPCTGTYSWCVEGDDGVRLWIDGTEVDNAWVQQGPTTYCSGAFAETGGTTHAVVMDYFQAGGGSVAQLQWNTSCAGNGVIPSQDLSPASFTPPTQGLTGTFYGNIDFTGPAFTEIDPGVNYNWNGGSTVSGSSGSNLSAEWTGQVEIPCSGSYQFCVVGDDGVRLWLDGTLVDDGWVYQGATTYCSTALPETAGTLHDVKMDYFQGGGGSVAELEWNAACLGLSAPQVIPATNLVPTGDQGLGGYNMPFRAAGDRGTGAPYSIISVPQIVNASPVDVSTATPNAWGLGPTAMMVPAFSPDATKLVFVDGDTSGGASWRQGLSIFNFNESQKFFSNRQNIVNTLATSSSGLSTNIIRWPQFESDSESIIFQTNPVNEDDINSYPEYGGMLPSGYSSIPGQFWTVDSANPTSHPPVSLAMLNAGLGGADSNRSYQPSVLPASAGGYRWTVFTSDRQYGNIMNVPASNSTPTTQLWVGALDDAVSGTTDRSHPPFWLPNQVLGDNGGRIRNERAYWVLDACKATLTSLLPPQPVIPTFTWKDQDIGSSGDPAYPGSASANGGTFTIVAGGDDIWNNNDAFHYVYMPISGDFQFQARVTSLAYADYWSKAGVMLRNDLSSGSAQTYMMINAGALTGLQWRLTNGNSSNWVQGPGESFPYWVRLNRTGSVVTGSISPDGVTWTTVGTQTPTIGTSAYIGLAVTAHNNGTTTTATFDNVSFSSNTPPDPRPASACQDDSDCCGAQATPATAVCAVDVPVATPVTRHCVPIGTNSCVAVGGACASDSDCCGFPSNTCSMGMCAAPRPPFTYTNMVYTRDYVASCPTQEKPVWRFFDWESVTPGNSDIKFAAATAASEGALPTTMGDPSVVPIGTASGAPATTWTGTDVGAALQAAGQSPSQWYLRVFMDFQPTSDGTQGPTLTAWRQQFDCVASE